MAEIGIAASVIGIAGAAATIAKGLYQIATDIGSAGKEVRLIAQDTNAFSHALTNLGRLLNSGSASTERARVIATDLVVLCKEILADSQMLLRVLQPLVKLTGKKWRRATLRLRWLFEKSKFAVHRQSLEALKATLTLLVATMTYADAASANIPEAVASTLRAQLDSVKEEVRLSAQDYEPLLLQIRDNVQAIRADALLQYSKIDAVNDEGLKDIHVEVGEGSHSTSPTLNDTTASTTNTEPGLSQALPTETDQVPDNTNDHPDINDSSEGLAVPVTALAIHTGLQGLPYLQRQAVHFAEDVLDMDYSTIATSSGTQDSEWRTAQARQWGTPLPIEAAPHVDSPGRNSQPDIKAQLEPLPERPKPEIERRWRQERALSEAWGKIAYRNFKKGDLVLFLPTKSQTTRSWAAFNVGAPHYFLREQPKHRLAVREWMLGRITHIEERVTNAADEDPDSNPFGLVDDLRWWFLDAEEDKGGAPATPDFGKSTVAASAIDAQGQAARKAEGKEGGTPFGRSLVGQKRQG